MKTFKLKRILVPVDFSECSSQALEYALAFAEQFQAQLTLLHVVEPAFAPDHYSGLAAPMSEVNDNQVQVGRERRVFLVVGGSA